MSILHIFLSLITIFILEATFVNRLYQQTGVGFFLLRFFEQATSDRLRVVLKAIALADKFNMLIINRKMAEKIRKLQNTVKIKPSEIL